MELDSTFFRTEVDGPVAHLIMNRPDKANSMSPDFWEDLPRLTGFSNKIRRSEPWSFPVKENTSPPGWTCLLSSRSWR